MVGAYARVGTLLDFLINLFTLLLKNLYPI